MEYKEYKEYLDKQEEIQRNLNNEISNLELELLEMNEILLEEKAVVKNIKINELLKKSNKEMTKQLEKSEIKIREFEKTKQQINIEIDIRTSALSIINEIVSKLRPLELNYSKLAFAKQGLNLIDIIKSKFEAVESIDKLLNQLAIHHNSNFPNVDVYDKDLNLKDNGGFHVNYDLSIYESKHSFTDYKKRNVLNSSMLLDFITLRESQYKNIISNNEASTRIEEPAHY